MAYALFVLICVIWGSSFILMKRAHLLFGPVSIGALRVLGGSVFLLLVWWLLSRGSGRRWPVRRRHLPLLALPVLIGMVYPFTMQPHLIGVHGHSSFFGMMVSLVPLLTIAVSVPMLGVWPTPRQLIGVLVGLGCLGVLGLDAIDRAWPWQTFALATSVPLAYAVSNTWVKRRLSDVPPMALTVTTLGLAAVVLLPAGAASEPIKSVSPRELWLAVGAVLVLGVVGTGLATVMFYRLVQQRGPLFAGMVTYGVSSIAVAWGWLDRERVTVTQVIALLGVLAATAVVQWPARSRAASELPSEAA